MDPLLNGEIRKHARRGTWGRAASSLTSMVAGAYRTELDITGKGWVLYVSSHTSDGSTKNQIRITIDGVATTLGTANGNYVYAYDNSTSGSRGGKLIMLDIPFNTSLKVESYNSDTATKSIQTEVDYILSA